MQQAEVQALLLTEFLKASLEVAALLELLGDPGVSDVLLVVRELLAFKSIFALRCFEDRISCQHACFHRVMCAFNLRHVEEASRAPGEHAAWEGQLRNSVVATFV